MRNKYWKMLVCIDYVSFATHITYKIICLLHFYLAQWAVIIALLYILTSVTLKGQDQRRFNEILLNPIMTRLTVHWGGEKFKKCNKIEVL